MKHTAGFRRGLPRKMAIALEKGPDAVVDLVRANSTPNAATGCWHWDRSVKDGYAWIVDPRRPIYRQAMPRIGVHRLLCEVVHRPMTPDEDARHLCHNKICVNPEHLAPGSRADNLNDSVQDGYWTFTRGAGNGRAKIGWDDVEKIRATHQRNTPGWAAKTAAEYGISESTARRIAAGTQWAAKPTGKSAVALHLGVSS